MADELAPTLNFKAEDIDFDLMESAVSTVVVERLEDRRWRDRRALRRFERNGPMRRLVTARAFKAYQEANPDADFTDVQSFMEWLIANWDSILKMVMSIISLFSV